jgi:hypothetical protein
MLLLLLFFIHKKQRLYPPFVSLSTTLGRRYWVKNNKFFYTTKAIFRLSSHNAATWQPRAEQKRDKTVTEQKHPKWGKVRRSECIGIRNTYARRCSPSRRRAPRSWWWGGRGWWGWGWSRRWTPPPPSPQPRTRSRPPSLRTRSWSWTVRVHRKIKVRKFPVPSRDVTIKLSLGVNNDVITELFLPRGSLVSDIPLETGNSWTFFYGVLANEQFLNELTMDRTCTEDHLFCWDNAAWSGSFRRIRLS